MRKKTNMSGLLSHTTPAGASYQSAESKCRSKLNKLEKVVTDGKKAITEGKNTLMMSFKEGKEPAPNTVVKVLLCGKYVNMEYSVVKAAGYKNWKL